MPSAIAQSAYGGRSTRIGSLLECGLRGGTRLGLDTRFLKCRTLHHALAFYRSTWTAIAPDAPPIAVASPRLASVAQQDRRIHVVASD